MLDHPNLGPRALLAAGLPLIVLLALSCQPSARPPRFAPDRELSGRADRVEATPRWRERVQHTRGELGEDLFPCLSADRKTLYFATSRFSSGFDLASRPLDGYTLTFLTNGEANDIHPDISPDGERLVFASDRTGRWNLYLRETRPGGEVKLLFPSDSDDLGPRWSPDGRTIAFFRRGSGEDRWEIWTVDATTLARSFLTEGLFPDWSPDGEWLAFQKGRQRGERWYSIWKIRADGARLVDLMSGWSDRWGAIQPSWSADGDWIAFTAVGKTVRPEPTPAEPFPGSDIYLLSTDGSRLVDLTGDRSEISEWNPGFAHDGRVYFTSDAGGSPRIWSVEAGEATGN